MKLAKVELEALALPEDERAFLAARLLETLPPPGADVSDEEVERRERELDSGKLRRSRTKSSCAGFSRLVVDEGGLPAGCPTSLASVWPR